MLLVDGFASDEGLYDGTLLEGVFVSLARLMYA